MAVAQPTTGQSQAHPKRLQSRERGRSKGRTWMAECKEPGRACTRANLALPAQEDVSRLRLCAASRSRAEPTPPRPRAPLPHSRARPGPSSSGLSSSGSPPLSSSPSRITFGRACWNCFARRIAGPQTEERKIGGVSVEDVRLGSHRAPIATGLVAAAAWATAHPERRRRKGPPNPARPPSQSVEDGGSPRVALSPPAGTKAGLASGRRCCECQPSSQSCGGGAAVPGVTGRVGCRSLFPPRCAVKRSCSQHRMPSGKSDPCQDIYRERVSTRRQCHD